MKTGRPASITTVNGHLLSHLADLTDAEAGALSAYKSATDDDEGQSQCFALNRKLEYGLFSEDMGSLGQLVPVLDRVFDRCARLKAPLVVYRAIGLRLHHPLTEPGACFRNLSYWSTSVRREVAIDFLKAEMNQASGALLKLDLPVGLPAYDLETLPGAGGHEAEILLPRGIIWRTGAAKLLDMEQERLLDHVKSKFRNIVEVELEASPAPRTR